MAPSLPEAYSSKFCSQLLTFSLGPSMNAPLPREIPADLLNASHALSQVPAQWASACVTRITAFSALPDTSPPFHSARAETHALAPARYASKSRVLVP